MAKKKKKDEGQSSSPSGNASSWSQEGSGLDLGQWQAFQEQLQDKKESANSGQRRRKLQRRIDAAGNVIENWVYEDTGEPAPPPGGDDGGGGGGDDGGGYEDWGGGGRDPLDDRNIMYDEWANQTDREAAYFRYLRNYLNIDFNGVDSDYTDWIRSQYQTMDEDWRVATGNSYALWNPGDSLAADEEVVVGSDGQKRKRKKRKKNADGTDAPLEPVEGGFDTDGDGVPDTKLPAPPDFWEYLANNLTNERFGTQSEGYQNFWANRNQRAHYLNQLGAYGYDTGGNGTQNEYQQWLTGEAFRPYEEGFQRARQADPNLQFRAYLGGQLGGADLGVEGDTYQDYWGDRNQAAKFTNWARSQGLGQIDNAHNPFTAYVQGEGGMGKLQRAWNQDTGGSTWNDFLKTQDPSKFANDFLRAGRSKQGKAGNAFGSGPGRWSTFG